jgi:hypothetical protein
MPTTHDDSSWPIVVVKMSSEPRSYDEMTDHLAKVRALSARGKHALIFDIRAASPLTPVERKRVVESMERSERAPGGSNTISVAQVCGGPVQAGILTVIMWLARPPYPSKAVSTMEDALAWTREQLANARADQPPRAP